MGANKIPNSITNLLEKRIEKHLYRNLKTSYPAIDFSSNDYLGFSTLGLLKQEINALNSSQRIGSTGSRLISGNSVLFEETETQISDFHHADAALLFNSGYDANIGLLSSIPQKGDLILSDELIHASLIDGIRLSYATHYKFNHNSISALEALLTRHKDSFNEIYIVVESIYSMDGDSAPLKYYAELSNKFGAHLIVDEAHAIGVFGDNGRGLCHLMKMEDNCFARIYTYGKAMGCHGAAIVGSKELKQYLINFSRSFIYTTAMSEHSLLAIIAAYRLLKNTNQLDLLRNNILYFNSQLNYSKTFIESNSAIHCKIKVGNEQVQKLEEICSINSLFVKSIKSPTVKANQERIRICLHAFNTKKQIDLLFDVLEQNHK